jgi:sugar lactone lactonase YvrE
MPLEKASENAKTSSLFHDISDGIKYVQLTLKKVVQNRQENKNRMKIEEKAIVRNISAFKASVIKTLDELEKSALLELQTVSQDSIGQMVKEETEVNNSVSLIDKHLQQLDFLTKNGSNQHVFRLLHQLLPILSKEHAHLEEMITNHPDVSLVYEQPDHLLSDIKTLGTIRLQKTPCTVRFKPLKHTEAQEVFVQSKTPKSFTFCYRIDRTFGEVTGMVVDKDDNLILADKSFLRMYSQDGKYIKECRLGGYAWDISYHKQSGRIVVALQSSGIQFVDSFTAQKKIIVQNMTYCRGVMWVDNNVYVSGYDRYGSVGEINILDSHGSYISSISSSRGIDYIHHRDNHIYYTGWNIEVYCIKKDGSNLFTFSSPDLQGTFGIDTDRPGNLYVVGWRSHNIVRLSPDGQNSDIVLKKVDGIKKPQTLCFSRDFKKLFVSNEDGKRVDVYNCEY